MSGQGTKRLHYMDHLRAHMMLLGLVFHGALSYSHVKEGEVWTYVESASHSLFDILCSLTHLFRMPAFFLVAGFFAALIMRQRSIRYFVRDRSLRILLPLLLLAPLNDPLTQAIYGWSSPLSSSTPVTGQGFQWHHLWFLYFLVLFYSLHLALHPLLARIDARFVSFWRRQPVHRLALPFGLMMGLAFLCHGSLQMDAPFDPLPPIGPFLLYLNCYALGASLYRHPALAGQHPDLLRPGLVARYWLGFAVLYLAAANLVLFPSQIGSNGFNPVSAFAAGMAKLFSAVLVLALYQKLLRRESAFTRYLSNSAYWLYLVHFPLMLSLPPLLHDWAVPPTLKFPVVLGLTLAVGLLTYEGLVRDTPLGTLLNGKRFPRQPAQPSVPQPVADA